jgi:hypothetical protein
MIKFKITNKNTICHNLNKRILKIQKIKGKGITIKGIKA